ncbi:hypothetical protein HKX48_002043 [Thoreauomyces humboldtii]|nr:hypothetical protein HKX48_002043 [Thoreauomyces humboldtii]
MEDPSQDVEYTDGVPQTQPAVGRVRNHISMTLAFVSSSATIVARVWLTLVIVALILTLLLPNFPSSGPASAAAGRQKHSEGTTEGRSAGVSRENLVNITFPETAGKYGSGSSSGSSGTGRTRRIHKPAITAVPALFGPLLDDPRRLLIVVKEGEKGCSSFSADIPAIRAESYITFGSLSDDEELFILLPRGGCPFDTKVRHAQQAGFAGAIIHNVVSTFQPDVQVKMQTVNGRQAPDIVIPALFLTAADGNAIRVMAKETGIHTIRAVEVVGTPLSLTAPSRNGSTSKGRAGKNRSGPGGGVGAGAGYPIDPDQDWETIFEGFWGDAVVSAACLLLGALGVMAVGSSLILLHNRMFDALGLEYGYGFQRRQPTRSAPRTVSKVKISSDGELTIERIRFPLRVLTQQDVDSIDKTGAEFVVSTATTETAAVTKPVGGPPTLKGGGGKTNDHALHSPLSTDICAICIDDFVVGSHVRELTCRHSFHAGW